MLFLLWINAVQPFAFATSADFFEKVGFPTHCTHLSICWAGTVCVGEWNYNMCISVLQAFWFVLTVASHLGFILCFLQIFCQSLLFFFFKFSRKTGYVFWASALLAHARTCSLFTFSFSSTCFSSFIISMLMSLSFSPCMNCSFNCLSISL